MKPQSINIAIIEDLPVEKERLKQLITKYAVLHSLEIMVSAFSCGEEFLNDYQAFRYTLVFMDIYMGGMNGIETAKRMCEMDPDTPIVFLTVSTEHMPDAFCCHAYDYIQKPVEETRIFKTLDDAFRLHSESGHWLTFSYNSKEVCIPFSRIIFVRSQGHYTEIQTRDMQNFFVRINFSTISETLMQEKRFLLLIREILVNMDCIVRFSEEGCLLENEIRLQVNVRNKNKIEQIWQNYMFDKIRNQMNGEAKS